jgi:hypothetical protein
MQLNHVRKRYLQKEKTGPALSSRDSRLSALCERKRPKKLNSDAELSERQALETAAELNNVLEDAAEDHLGNAAVRNAPIGFTFSRRSCDWTISELSANVRIRWLAICLISLCTKSLKWIAVTNSVLKMSFALTAAEAARH